MKNVFYLLFFIGSLFAEQGNWVWKNPYTTGNDLMDICAIDENTVVAVGIFGTIVRTDDGGKTWRQLDAGTGCDFNSVYFVDAQAGWAVGGWPNQTYLHFPDDQKEGEIYRTMDGGETWERLLFGDYRESYLDVFFVDRMHGWVLTSHYGILKTNNGGESWDRYSIGNLTYALSFYFIDKNRGWIIGRNRIYRTLDGGKTWQVQYYNTDRSFSAIYFVDDDTGWVVGAQISTNPVEEGSIIMKTTDGGYNWVLQDINDSCMHHSVCFADSLNGWVSGDKIISGPNGGYVMHTHDGGTTWEEYLFNSVSKDFWANSVSFSDKNTGWVVAYGGMVIRTEDSGTNWDFCSGFTLANFYDICFTDDNTGWLTGREKVWKTVDRGNHWFINFDSSDVDIYRVCFKNIDTGWLACLDQITDQVFLLRTNDGGQSWTRISLPSNNYRFISDMTFVDTQTGWLILYDYSPRQSGIFYTCDGGETWQIKYGTTYKVESIFALNDSAAYALEIRWPLSNVILKTSDGGNTWQEQFTNPRDLLRSVFFIDSCYGWISGRDSSGSIILRTTDGAKTWQRISTEGDESRSVYFLDRNNGFALDSYHQNAIILQTGDGGVTWQRTLFNVWEGYLGEILFLNSSTGWACGHAGALLKYEGPPVISTISSPSSDLKINKFYLSQNYPNPFNPVTTITYTLTRNSIVALSIYNTLGQEVRTLVNARQATGEYQAVWDGRDNHSRPVPSGVYIYRLQGENFSDSRKTMLIR